MYDANLYSKEAIKLLREHWQKTKGKPDHSGRMKTGGVDAARKAVETLGRKRQPRRG
jgi:hypothetical protein